MNQPCLLIQSGAVSLILNPEYSVLPQKSLSEAQPERNTSPQAVEYGFFSSLSPLCVVARCWRYRDKVGDGKRCSPRQINTGLELGRTKVLSRKRYSL